MAHKLYFNELTQQHSFFSVREKVWHNLGQIVEDYPTSEEALNFAGLNFEVEKRKLFTYGNDFFTPDAELQNNFATVRTDTNQILGVVGKDYEIVQNKQAFTFFDAITGTNDGVFYETAGALGLGEKIFITAKLPDYIKVGSDDLIEKYIFLTTSHDGSGSITAAFTPIRIVCNNTLNAALANCSNVFKIRHTQSATETLKQAHKIMGISNQLANEMEDIFNHWAKIQITDKQVLQLIEKALAPSKEALFAIEEGKRELLSTSFKNITENAFEYAMSNETQQMTTTKGTLFGAYNAVTGYLQNVKSYKDAESKLKSVLMGSGYNKTQAAFNICQTFAKTDDIVLN